MDKISRRLLFTAAIVFSCWSAASAQTATIMWDESPAASGYSLTVDGVRTDYHLSPVSASGTCGCTVPLPFSGGRHTIVVGAYNAGGETLSAPIIVGPSANAAGPYAGQAGTALTVNASGSIAPTGTITTYAWNWGDGTGNQVASALASHIYSSAGTYTIALTITDNAGATATATTTATIASVAPTSPPSTPSNPMPASGSLNVPTFPVLPTLTWSAGGATSYTINFGTVNPPPQAATGLTSTSYAPPSLFAGTTYFWQIIARNTAGATAGPVWSFATAASTTTPTASPCPCSLWTNATTPGALNGDTNAVEVGLKFTADISGYVTGVRFYKYAQNTGPHIGNVWTASGTLLGTVTFTGETASGWQQATFATPIAITANTTYVVSYYTPTGNYAYTNGGLANSVDRAPLHAPSNSSAGGNGVYQYGGPGTFPAQSWKASNYWVDVVFDTAAAVVYQPPAAPSAPSPATAATGTSLTPTLTWSASGATSYTINFGTVNPPPQAATGLTSAWYAPASLAAGTTYFWQIIARNTVGATTGPVWSFTTAAPTTTPTATPCPCSLWTNATTPGGLNGDTNAVEVGLKFTSDISGYVTGVRFYKYSTNTGPHIGNVWTASGTLLGTVTFTGETVSGWQQATFAVPIPITANTTYVVSYYTPTGNYAYTNGGLANSADRAPLHAPSSSAAGGNGVYQYGATSAFPTQSWKASNYWVDVVVTP